jgi:hypothetical protein
MPRGSITKDIIIYEIIKLKQQLSNDTSCSSDPKELTNNYLNKLLDKISEYAR